MNRFDPSMSWDDPQPSQQSQTTSGSGHPYDDSDHQWSPVDGESGESWEGDGSSPGHFGHRSYFLPLHYEPNYRYPLIVWLHSDGFNENQVDHVMPHISVRNYIAAGVRGIRAADSVGHRFDWHDSPASVAAAEDAVSASIDEASEQFSVHPERIVLAGYGTGGTMAMRIAMSQPRRFAAAISLGGVMPSGRNVLSNLAALRSRRMPMLWLWGTEGRGFEPQRLKDDIRLAMMIRASVEIRQYSTEDEMDTVALADVNEWIMSRVVSDRSSVADQRWATSPTAYSAN